MNIWLKHAETGAVRNLPLRNSIEVQEWCEENCYVVVSEYTDHHCRTVTVKPSPSPEGYEKVET